MLNSLRAQHIDLKTEKTIHVAGETVKGNFILTTNKSFKVRDVSVSMYCKERTNIKTISSNRFLNKLYTPAPAGHNVYKALYTLISWDVSQSELFPSIGAKQLDLYTLEIPAGIKQFPFEFILPEDIPESYKGRSVSITYTIEAKVDIPNSIGLRKTQEITIVSPSKNYDNNNNDISIDGHKGLNENQRSNEIPVHDDAAKTSILQEEHGTKKTNTIQLGLYKKIFSRGEKIIGKVVLMNITQPEKIREVKISLIGMEHATVDTENIWNRPVGIYGGSYDPTDENKVEKYTEEIEIPKKEGDIIIVPFEFQIPKQVKRSYTGKYSKFYWLIDAKIDMKGMIDSHAYEEITII